MNGPEKKGNQTAPLYDASFEHDACGIGAVVDIKGRKTHKTVDDALKIVEKLEHRAGKDAEGKTGDGVGILLQISHRFFSKAAEQAGFSLPGERDYGIGMFFFPQDTLKRSQAKKLFEIIIQKEGMEFLGWRTVPVKPSILGTKARDKMPYIEQGFVLRPKGRAAGSTLTAGCTLRGACLSSRASTRTWPRCRAARLSTKACS